MREIADPDILAERLGERDLPRPEGRLVWAHLGEAAPPTLAPPLLHGLREEDGATTLVVTIEPSARAPVRPEGAMAGMTAPADHPPFVRAFLDRWRPDACVYASGRLRPALMDGAMRRMPLVVAGARAEPARGRALRLPAALMSRAHRVMALDARDAQGWRRLGAPSDRVEVSGPLQTCALPPPDEERARREIAERLAGRPVWFACAVPDALTGAVIEAHGAILRRSHRALLVIEPASGRMPRGLDPARVAEHDAEDPEGCAVEDVHEVVLARGAALRGLWFRMAPVTLMADTLAAARDGEEARARADPDAPAALGSAVVHGRHPGAREETYARLLAGEASLEVAGPDEVAGAIEALLAPDRAARQAHAAWSVVTRGAEATDRLAALLMEAMDG